MNRKPLLLAALAALAVAAAAAAAVVLPPVLDWNRYRDTIAAEASDRLGRPVTVAGTIRLTLWPAPELTAEQVDVGGDGRGGSSFHVAALRLRVGLGALLAGRVEARDLVLRGLDLRLPWPLPQAVLASRPPRWLGAFAAHVEDGTLRLGELTVRDVDGTITQGEDGTLAASGTARLNTFGGRFSIRLAAPQGDGSAGLEVSLDGAGKFSGTGVSFSGNVAADGSLAGHVMARGTDLALLVNAPSLPFHADGRLTVGDGLAAMDEATFDLAGAPASGALALRFTPVARLDVALSATRLDLDPWLADLLPASGRGPARSELPVGLDLAVEAAQLGGGTLQRLRARADSAGGKVTLSDVSAILPGDAVLHLDGSIDALPNQPPRLLGTVQVVAPALRTTLAWLSGSGLPKLPLPTGAVLRTARFAAKLRAEPGSFVLEDVAGRLDGAAVAGSLRLDGGAHPGFAVDVATDNLAIDPWLPADAPAGAPASPARWLAQGLAQGGLAKLIGGETTQVSVRAEHAALDGMPIEGLLLDATTTPDGRLTLRQLDGTASGLRLIASGSVGGDGRVADLKMSLSGPSAKPLAALAPAGFATPALWKGAVSLTIRGDGPPAAMSLSIALDLGDARLEAQPVVDLTSGAWQASATLRHPGAARLLGMFGLSEPPDLTGASDWLGEGSLSLIGQFSGTSGSNGWERLTADNFVITAGLLRAHGRLALDQRQVTGSVVADVLPLPLPAAASGTPLPVLALRGWHGAVQVQAAQVVAGPLELDNAAFNVTLTRDMLTIDGLTAQAAGGAVAGSASLNVGASPPTLTAAAALHDAAIRGSADSAPFGLLSGRVEATANVAASGYSPAALLATLSGNLQVTARDGALTGFDLFGAAHAIDGADGRTPAETEQVLRTALLTGTTSFDRLDIAGEASHGLLHLARAQLQGPAGSADAQGDISLTDGTMDVQVALSPSVPGAPPVGLRLDGLMSAPSHQPELAAASRWLAERPTTR